MKLVIRLRSWRPTGGGPYKNRSFGTPSGSGPQSQIAVAQLSHEASLHKRSAEPLWRFCSAIHGSANFCEKVSYLLCRLPCQIPKGFIRVVNQRLRSVVHIVTAVVFFHVVVASHSGFFSHVHIVSIMHTFHATHVVHGHAGVEVVHGDICEGKDFSAVL